MSDSLPKRRFTLLLLIFFCFWVVSANAEQQQAATAPEIPQAGPPAKLAAVLSPTVAAVGETATVTLAYVLPTGCGLAEKPAIEGLAGLSVIDLQTTAGTIVVRLIVDSLTDLSLGPFSLICQDAAGARQKISSDKLTLQVTSNHEKSTDQQLKPIFDIIPAFPVWLTWLLWGGGAVVIILAGVGLFFWYRRRAGLRKSQTVILPAHIRAQGDLEALNTSGLFERGEVKAYYYRYSEILKRYLEELRGFPAAEFTTEEIASRIESEIDRELVVLLKRADLVKFADDIPLSSRKDGDMEAALTYIATTAPRLEPESEKSTHQGGRP